MILRSSPARRSEAIGCKTGVMPGSGEQLRAILGRRLDRHALRAAAWALRASHRARRQLSAGGLHALDLPAAPQLAGAGAHGVEAVLARRRETCLIVAAVRQAWLAGQGERRDLVVGTAGAGLALRAHAWLEGDPPAISAGYQELTRYAYRRRPGRAVIATPQMLAGANADILNDSDQANSSATLTLKPGTVSPRSTVSDAP